LVSRSDIMDAVWPNVAVEENNLTVQLSALRRVLDAGRAQGSCVQTVPGRGYRFLPRVSLMDAGVLEAHLARLIRERTAVGDSDPDVVSPPIDPSPAVDPVSPRGAAPDVKPARTGSPFARQTGRLAWIAAAFCLLLAFGAGTWLWQAKHKPPPAGRPRMSIAVLPFENLSNSPADAYLADGITDDLTTDLSNVSAMFVIGRDSAYTYKNKPTTAHQIGDELGVRYVVEGSVRKLGDIVRVNVELISTETEAHLWADRFDQQLRDLNAGQEEIVRRIGETLNVALVDVESARSERERPTNPDAFDLLLRAQAIRQHPGGLRENAERLSLYERALRLDPRSVRAMTGLAALLIENWRPGDELDQASKLLADAAAINPNDRDVLGAQALLLAAQRRCGDTVFALQRLVDLYPNASPAYGRMGICLTVTGRAEQAVPTLEEAIRRDPRAPDIGYRYNELSLSLVMLGRDEESIDWSQRALAATPKDDLYSTGVLTLRLAVAQLRLGHEEEARRLVGEADKVWPYDTVRSRSAWNFGGEISSAFAEQMARYQQDLRRAGERDHADPNADFGVASDNRLHGGRYLTGLTPTTVPGAATIRTDELQELLTEQKPLVIDALSWFWGRSIQGAIGLWSAGGWGNEVSGALQDRLTRKMLELTGGDRDRPIVAVGWNTECFDGRNLALRLVAMGYTHVYWYRPGREAWEVAGLPEAPLTPTDW
jgi:adenylate cyclase